MRWGPSTPGGIESRTNLTSRHVCGFLTHTHTGNPNPTQGRLRTEHTRSRSNGTDTLQGGVSKSIPNESYPIKFARGTGYTPNGMKAGGTNGAGLRRRFSEFTSIRLMRKRSSYVKHFVFTFPLLYTFQDSRGNNKPGSTLVSTRQEVRNFEPVERDDGP